MTDDKNKRHSSWDQLVFGQYGGVVDINTNMPLLIWPIFAIWQGNKVSPSSSFCCEVNIGSQLIAGPISYIPLPMSVFQSPATVLPKITKLNSEDKFMLVSENCSTM